MIKTLHKHYETLFSDVVAWRRHFHQYPELSFQEVKTPEMITNLYRQWGIEVKTGVGKRGVVAVIRGKYPGKTIAFRADFDALPIQDEKEVAYKSKVAGVMHACGHDGHTATLLGVAKVLHDHRDAMCGTVVLIHQHAEEIHPGGAKAMIEDGCLDGVDAIFGTHLSSNLPYGKIGLREGKMMAAVDLFDLTIQGKGGHGGYPHQTVDAITVGASVVSALQQIVSRKVHPTEPAVVTIGTFQAGNAFNIIADSATMTGTVRTYDENTRDVIEKEFRSIVDGICSAFSAKPTLKYTRSYPAVNNHPYELSIVRQAIEEDFGETWTYEIKQAMGGEDFAYYLQKVPGAFYYVGARNEEMGAVYPHHHPKFDIDERSMLASGQLFLSIAQRYLFE